MSAPDGLRIRERWSGGLLPSNVELIHGDALAVLAALEGAGRTFELVYIDPPFALGRTLQTVVRFENNGRSGELERWRWSDAWGGLDSYLAFMEPVLRGIRGVLSEHGSLLLHCDHHAAPYLAVLCDQVFGLGDRGARAGAPGFRNELIWSYGLGGSSARCYPKKHDTIFWYTRGSDWFFAPPRVEATSARMRGQTKKAPDVLEIPALNNMAGERTGYPTQKPLALLEQLVDAHTREGDRVLDLFGGSGTTAAACVRRGRLVVSADASADAIALQRHRLLGMGAAPTVSVLNHTDSTMPTGPGVSAMVTRANNAVRLAVEPPAPPLVMVGVGRVESGVFVGRAAWLGGDRSPDGVFRAGRDVVTVDVHANDEVVLVADLGGGELLVPIADAETEGGRALPATGA